MTLGLSWSQKQRRVAVKRSSLCRKLKDQRNPVRTHHQVPAFQYMLPYRMIQSRWLVGTDDLCTVKIMHSSRVSKFWIFFRNFGLGAGYSIG